MNDFEKLGVRKVDVALETFALKEMVFEIRSNPRIRMEVPFLIEVEEVFCFKAIPRRGDRRYPSKEPDVPLAEIHKGPFASQRSPDAPVIRENQKRNAPRAPANIPAFIKFHSGGLKEETEHPLFPTPNTYPLTGNRERGRGCLFRDPGFFLGRYGARWRGRKEKGNSGKPYPAEKEDNKPSPMTQAHRASKQDLHP